MNKVTRTPEAYQAAMARQAHEAKDTVAIVAHLLLDLHKVEQENERLKCELDSIKQQVHVCKDGRVIRSLPLRAKG